MSKNRSFTEYISNRFYDELFSSLSIFITERLESLELRSYVVENIDSADLTDITIKRIYIEDRGDMAIAFDIAIEAELEVSETHRRWDTQDVCTQWFLVSCTANLSHKLNDFKITNVDVYSQRSFNKRPLSDSLVPYMNATELDAVATDFLRRNYPQALLSPMAIDVTELASSMGLQIKQYHIEKDFSVFGQIFFSDCDTEIYDETKDRMIPKNIKGGTIVVDPKSYYLRNLGSVNNTIVHECVHWDRHRKAFELERLYNESVTQIKCQVIGGVKESNSRSATDWMEWQANALAPRIQMPLTTFRSKANELIRKYQKNFQSTALVDVMEPVIDELAVFFCVSRHAAKIRMVDVGFEDAVGAFTYIDGKYVKPHAFKKGAIRRNQTYCISQEEASVVAFSDIEFSKQSNKGVYLYIDTHMCINTPKYIIKKDDGTVEMTDYARLHLDECCIAFDLKVTSKNKYCQEFYKECVLFRDIDSGITFETTFSKESNKSVIDMANSILSHETEIQTTINNMPLKFGDALEYLMKWSKITVEKLAEEALVDPKTIQRMRNNPSYPKNINCVIAVCIAMHLPPEISNALIDKSGFTFRLAVDQSHLLYSFFLKHYYMHSVADCNTLLLEKGFSDLTGKE